MKKLLAILSLALLASCGGESKSDLKQTRDDPYFLAEVVLIPAERIVEHCSNLGVKYEANGCTAFYPDQKRCIIYVMPQRFTEDKERLQIIGHELWHCRFGEWHD